MLDLACIRADTPATQRRAYLHNAGAALTPAPIVAAMKDYLDLEAEIGGYAAATREAARLDSVYASVARLLNARPDEIALVENATVAWQMAFYALALTFKPGDRILTAEAEYAANYVAFLQIAQRSGIEIDVVPSDASGALDVAALERMIDRRVKLIAITWVPTNGGLANPERSRGRTTFPICSMAARPWGRWWWISRRWVATCSPRRDGSSCGARAAAGSSISSAS